MPADDPFSSCGFTASSRPVSGWSPQARRRTRVFFEGGLNAGATGIAVLAFAPGALSLSLISGAPPSAHAAMSAISNGDSDGSFAKSP